MAAASFFTFLFTVIGMAASQTIGNCNLTFFTSGGLLCQRKMIDDLNDDTNLTCSEANANQTSCLRSHVSACVSGDPLLGTLGDEITSLLSTLLYNCGNFNFTEETVNPAILTVAQCSYDKLKDIGDCWNEFHSTFKQNRNDSSLCRKYADSKQKCSNIARASCKLICNYVEKDEYNPFCADKSDPAGTSEMYDCDRTLGCQESQVYEEAMNCEMESFTDFANTTEDDCSIELDKNKLCLRNKLLSLCPKMNNSASLFDEAVTVLRAALMTKRFFCQKVDLNVDSIDDRLMKTIPCDDDFFDAAEKCAESFRNIYTSAKVKKDNEVCKAFATAKQCLNKAHKDHCRFDDNIIKAAMFDERNPFCESGKDPKTGSGAEKTQMATLIVFFLSLSAIFATQ